MLKQWGLLAVVGVAMLGAVAANAEPAPAMQDSLGDPATTTTDKGGHIIRRSLGAGEHVYVESILFGRESQDAQRLDVQMRVDACTGEGCEKKLHFVLSCTTSMGEKPFEIISPWYKIAPTEGLTTKTFRFKDPQISKCNYIPKIDLAVEPGWEGAID